MLDARMIGIGLCLVGSLIFALARLVRDNSKGFSSGVFSLILLIVSAGCFLVGITWILWNIVAYGVIKIGPMGTITVAGIAIILVAGMRFIEQKYFTKKPK